MLSGLISILLYKTFVNILTFVYKFNLSVFLFCRLLVKSFFLKLTITRVVNKNYQTTPAIIVCPMQFMALDRV